MKANELRIGNCVYVTNRMHGFRENRIEEEINKNIQVSDVSQFGINIQDYNGDDWDVIPFENICGIPLTEEWLLKLGFKEDDNRFIKENQNFRVGLIRYESEPQVFIFYLSADLNNTNAIDVNAVKYVHQLQNLYFALTGEDMDINAA